jgi:hypothetical protein
MLFDDGLDPVELLMMVEDCFGISIADRDAEQLRTAGQLCDYVCNRVCVNDGRAAKSRAESRCISATAFFRVRRVLAMAREVQTRSIRPDSPIDRFLPKAGRRAGWRRIGHAMGVTLPPLEFPPLLAVLPFAVLAVGLAAGVILQSATPILGASAGFIVAILALGVAEYFLGWRVPHRFQTVGAVSVLLMPTIVNEGKGMGGTWTQPEVWQIVRTLIARLAGVRSSSIRRDTDLIRDLA